MLARVVTHTVMHDASVFRGEHSRTCGKRGRFREMLV
jgi:hypothetical protein